MSGNQVLQAALLLQICRWERNTFYIKYSEHCSAEVTMDVPAQQRSRWMSPVPDVLVE